MSNTNATALTVDQVKDQIRAWYNTGLPEGKIFLRESEHVVHIEMPDPNGVATWAVALGVEDLSGRYGAVSVGIAAIVHPVDLAGWRLQVWCDTPVVQPEQRIAVRGASS